MINHKFGLNKSFQEILYRIDNWINEGAGWIVELIKLKTLTFQFIGHYQEGLT